MKPVLYAQEGTFYKITQEILDTQAANRKEWVAALRSGKYVQGGGFLRTPEDKYCCLGVLCDLQESPGWTQEKAERAFTTALGEYFVPGPTTRMMVGLRSERGSFEITEGLRRAFPKLSPGALTACLTELNDTGGFTLNEIADLIEAGPKYMFYDTPDTLVT